MNIYLICNQVVYSSHTLQSFFLRKNFKLHLVFFRKFCVESTRVAKAYLLLMMIVVCILNWFNKQVYCCGTQKTEKHS